MSDPQNPTAPDSAPQIRRRDALWMLAGLALPASQLAGLERLAESAAGASVPRPDPAGPPPDLANFHPMMEWIARQHAPKLSFTGDRWQSLEEWKHEARPVFRAALSYDPPAVPLSARVLSTEQRDGYRVETVAISATETYEIPARVLVPTGRKGKLPAVLALHCHSGKYTWGHEKVLSAKDEPAVVTEFRAGTYGRPWAESLVRRGYIVIAIDAFYFGERRLRVEDLTAETIQDDWRAEFERFQRATPGTAEWVAAVNRVCRFYEHLTAKTIFAAGATWPGLHAWDDRRSVDYLLSRDDVDPARIGCIGLSGGGFRTALAIGSDPRIKAACLTGWMTEFAHQLRNHLRSHTWMVYVPGLYPSLDLPDVAMLHAPGALLVQQCSRDRLYPLSGMKGAADKLTRMYAKAGIPERFKASFHDVPHSFRPEMQEEAFDWLDRWL